ncbi:hypothetical protein OIU77_014123 [Salix suchowensis]|uniref:Uncharacterized protein n=1 Tax=Salix suchowensis TaxID=1278906 RepID=A0ABQ8ZW93_9ROSI|nr:hypothetical protein OIU77_014123 [Salix suchowensis]
MEELQNNKKRVRDDFLELELDLPEVKKIREDLLGTLDESDPDSLTQDLDSVMKSFEQEISASSDDELGLPPTINSSSEEVKGEEENELVQIDSTESSGIGGELWGFEDQIPTYDSFGLGVGDSNYNSGYVAFDDGLFEYSNVCFGSSEFLDLS